MRTATRSAAKKKFPSSSVMPHVMFLTKDEQKLFSKLPSSLQEGWEVKEEMLTFDDSDERRRMRIAVMHLHDPKLLSFQEKAGTITNAEELFKLAGKIDLTKVQESDLAEIYFALGPSGISMFVIPLLEEAQSDDKVESVAALTHVRHALLESMQPVS
ncbi:hypothetical protein HY213_00470 [Candidatus Peregrinibacteria bacterium]|nr:hypothetical protein [Candidatus Peregrinibacteria bacterium]